MTSLGKEKTLVIKLGGAALRTPEHFLEMAKIIAERRKVYPRIVVVVSAMGDTTDALIDLAYQVHENPPQREYDMLVTVGERISTALLAMAFDRLSINALSFTGSQSGIITTADHKQAKIVDVRPHRIIKCLDEGKIAITAGFQGVSLSGDITTLGRGESDMTAVAIAIAVEAEKVEFYKDVQGIFDRDPHKYEDAKFLEQLTYNEALTISQTGAQVLSERCLYLAKNNSIPLVVRSFVAQYQNKMSLIGEQTRTQFREKYYEISCNT